MPHLAPDPATDSRAATARRLRRGPEREVDLDRRYRRKLERYARSLLGRSEHDAQDVVQDVLIKVAADRRAGREPDALEPWLYRLVRNRAIDEMRRARWGESSLDMPASGGDDHLISEPAALVDEASDPSAVLARKQSLRDLVSDLADLPVRQRAALLGCVVDGESTQAVAGRLGVSVEATQMLVTRARRGLVRARDIREADVRVLDQRLHALAPPTGLFAVIGLGQAAAVKVLAAIGVGAATTAAVVVAAVSVVGGPGVHVVSATTVAGSATTPLRVFSAPSIQPVKRGGTVTPGVSLVTARVHLPLGSHLPNHVRTVRLTCPAGSRFASVLAQTTGTVEFSTFQGPHVIGHSRFVTLTLAAPHGRATDGTVGIACRHLDVPAALAKRVAAFTPAAADSVPSVRGGLILEHTPTAVRALHSSTGQLFLYVRLTGSAAAAADGYDLYASIDGADVHQFAHAEFSTAVGHCYEAQPTVTLGRWRPGEHRTVRLWIGDGHGHAAQITRTVTIPRPRALAGQEPATTRQFSPTRRLGCYSPHL